MEPPYDRSVVALMTPETMAPSDSNVYGDPAAPITIVEFADFFCPACHKVYPLVKKIIDNGNGRLRLVYRNFPLMQEKGHELAWQAAVVAQYAAEKGRFWQFADAFHAHPPTDFKNTDDLIAVLDAIGLNGHDCDQRWKDDTDPAFKKVYLDYQLGNKLGLILTPTFVIVAPGVRPQVCTQDAIESDLTDPRYDRFKSPHASN